MDDLEADLVVRAKNGDTSAGPFLVSYYGERLLGFARAHAPDLSDPDREQIVELAIEAGVRAIGKFDSARGNLRSWFRQQVRYQTLAWHRAHPSVGQLPDDAPAVPADDSISNPTTTEALRRAIGRLSREDQLIVALRDVEQLDYREIALRLDIKEATARKRHARAMERLAAQARCEPALRELDGVPPAPSKED